MFIDNKTTPQQGDRLTKIARTAKNYLLAHPGWVSQDVLLAEVAEREHVSEPHVCIALSRLDLGRSYDDSGMALIQMWSS